MKVRFLNPTAVLGGAERSLLDMVAAARLRDPHFDPSAVLLDDGPLVGKLRSLDVPTRVVPLPESLRAAGDSGIKLASLAAMLAGSIPRAFRFTSALRDALATDPVDVVHSNGFKTHLLSSLTTPAETPLIWHVRDFVRSRPLVRKLILVAAATRRARGPLGIIANSKSVAKDVSRVLPAVPAIWIHNAIDLATFFPGPSTAEWRGQGDASTVHVGLVAAYARWKGQDVFIDAISLLDQATRARARFYIIGGPIYRTSGSQWSESELLAMIRARNLDACVRLVPFQTDPAGAYRALDVVVHASTSPEPFGRTIVEAMACRCAVIATAAGGAAEIIRDGVTAVAVRPGDAAGLATAMRGLILSAERRRALAAAARRESDDRFGLPPLGDALLAAWRGAAGGKWS